MSIKNYLMYSSFEKIFWCIAEKVKDRSNGDETVDAYHRYKV